MSSETEHCFVGRQALLQEALHDPQGAFWAASVTGVLGMGKSTFLAKAGELGRPVFAVHLVDAEQYDPGLSRPEGATDYGEVYKNYHCFRRLATDIVKALHPTGLERLLADEHAGHARVLDVTSNPLISNTIHAGQGSTVIGSSQVVNTASLVGESLQKAAMSLVRSLTARLQEAAVDKPVLLLVDNGELLADKDVGHWLRASLEPVDGLAVLLTHEPGRHHPFASAHCHPLPPLTVAEVAEYFRTRAAPAPVPDDVALVAHQFSSGFPSVVSLIYDLLYDTRTTTITLDDLRAGMAEWRDPDDRLAKLVEKMLAGLPDKHLVRALQAASVPRRIEAPLLENLLVNGFKESPVDVAAVLDALIPFSFTHEFETGGGRFYMRVAPYLARALARRMRKLEPDTYSRLHAVAAEWFFSQAVSEKRGYGEWFYFEEPEQQEVLHDWLYHLSRSGDRTSAFRQLAFVFLDAFWWWGNYVRSDFCAEVVSDVKQLAAEVGVADLAGRETTAFAHALEAVLRAYPNRSTNHREFELAEYPAADWDTVRQSLQTIRDLCRLRRRNATWDEACVHVAALLDIFTAHSYRYQAGGQAGADQWYERAAAALVGQPEERWTRAWVDYERGDLAAERGDLDAALRFAESSARLVYEIAEDEEDFDEELVANLHRLRGDCHAATGELRAAATAYAVSVMHAYRFHPVGGPPDEYTMTFYNEIRWRAVMMLLQLWHGGTREAAVDAAVVMQAVVPHHRGWQPASEEELRPLLESGAVLRLAGRLFPRGPKVEEVGEVESPFMDQWREVDSAWGEAPYEDLTSAGMTADGSRAQS